jgi:hypothetical protein
MRAITTKGMHTAIAIVVLFEIDFVADNDDDGDDEDIGCDTDGI